MATYSTVLGLKLNDQSDPFSLADFTSNYEILDASPGIYICTSTSRPAWGTAQAGRLIFMTDLKQLSYWNGTAWTDPRDAAPVFAGGVYLNQNQNAATTSAYGVLTITPPRPCALAIWLSGAYSCPGNKFQNVRQSITFDGVAGTMGGFPDTVRFPADPSESGVVISSCSSMNIIPSVSAGQHQIGASVNLGGGGAAPVTVVGFKVLGLIAVYASGNIL